MSTDDRLSIEDRVRIATRARASLVRDIRPLPAPGLSYLRHRRAPRASRWLTWGVPLAAAAAVVAVALSLAAVRHDNTMPVRPACPRRGSQGIPRYFVAMKTAGISGSRALIVGDDQTGTVIATVPAPRGVIFGGPHFGGVTDAGDDRTFVVTAENDHVYTFYLLRIAPGSARPYRLTRLPIAPVFDISSAPVLSPDGSKLAVLATRLSIFSVKSGKALRTWSGDTLHASNVSWEPDGRRVVFYAWNSGIRTLDVTTHATDILAASRAPARHPTIGHLRLGTSRTGRQDRHLRHRVGCAVPKAWRSNGSTSLRFREWAAVPRLLGPRPPDRPCPVLG